MARIPDPKTQRRDFAAMPFQQRRQVVSAVNRGREVADPRLAGHAVIVARRQARLWRWAWLLGPAVGAFRLIDSLQAALLSATLSTLVLGLMSWWWFSRARRAEALNFALTTEGKRAARKSSKGGGTSTGKATKTGKPTKTSRTGKGTKAGKATKAGNAGSGPAASKGGGTAGTGRDRHLPRSGR